METKKIIIPAVIGILLLGSLFSLSLFNSGNTENKINQTQNDTCTLNSCQQNNLNDSQRCQNSGGSWVWFGTPCSMDKCSQSSGNICIQVMTEGCQCGSSMCWNGTKCVMNP